MVAGAVGAFAKAMADETLRPVFMANGRFPKHTFESARLALNMLDIGSIEDSDLSRIMHLLSMHLSAVETDAASMTEINPELGAAWAATIVRRSSEVDELYEAVRHQRPLQQVSGYKVEDLSD